MSLTIFYDPMQCLFKKECSRVDVRLLSLCRSIPCQSSCSGRSRHRIRHTATHPPAIAGGTDRLQQRSELGEGQSPVRSHAATARSPRIVQQRSLLLCYKFPHSFTLSKEDSHAHTLRHNFSSMSDVNSRLVHAFGLASCAEENGFHVVRCRQSRRCATSRNAESGTGFNGRRV